MPSSDKNHREAFLPDHPTVMGDADCICFETIRKSRGPTGCMSYDFDQSQSDGDDTSNHTEVHCEPCNLFHDASSFISSFPYTRTIRKTIKRIKWYHQFIILIFMHALFSVLFSDDIINLTIFHHNIGKTINQLFSCHTWKSDNFISKQCGKEATLRMIC